MDCDLAGRDRVRLGGGGDTLKEIVCCGGSWAGRCRSGGSRGGQGYKERFTLVTSVVEFTGLEWWSCSRRGSGRRTPSGT